MNDLALAKLIATKFHAGQKYGKEDYVYHLEAVAAVIRETDPNDERLEVIAWLHDIDEDTECTVEILAALFDEDIVKAVVALTHASDEPRSDYLARVKAHPLALKVKRADSFCNLRESLVRGDLKRVKKYGNQLAELA